MARTNAWHQLNPLGRIRPATAAAVMTLLALAYAGAAAQQGRLIENPIRNIPKWVRMAFTSQHLGDRYTITYQLYPPTLKGDFNGDGRRDVAILVQENSTKKFGIAIFHGKKTQDLRYHVAVLGAGTDVGKAGDNFSWANLWARYSPGKSPAVKGLKIPDDLTNDAIELRKKGGRSGLLYWDGKHYVWSSGSK